MSTYTCGVCGEDLEGAVGYCDGCGRYYHLTCAVAGGEGIYDCPNCAIEMQMATI